MKEGVESLGRVRAQAIVLLVFAFLGGAFIGGTMERVMRHRGPRPPTAGTGGSPRGGFGFACGGPSADGAPRPPAGLPTFYESLGLTVEQRASIEAIYKKRAARVDSAMATACKVIGPARDSSAKEINAVLNADQKTKRDSLRANRGGRGRPFGRGGDSPRPTEFKRP